MDDLSERNLQLLISELRESEDVIVRIACAPSSKRVQKQIAKMRLLDLDIDLLDHVVYPGLHLEYVLYRERLTQRRRMAFLT